MPGFLIHHQLLELTQTHVHWVGDAIQPSHPLLSPSPPAFKLSQHQGLFKWVGSSGGQSTGVSASTSVLPMNIQVWFPLGLTGWISLQSKGLSRVFSSTTVWKHQFFGAHPSIWFNSHLYIIIGKTTGVVCHSLLQGSSWPKDQTWVSCIAGRFFTVWAAVNVLVIVPFSPRSGLSHQTHLSGDDFMKG